MFSLPEIETTEALNQYISISTKLAIYEEDFTSTF